MLLEHAFRRHIAMKRPFCRPSLLWEYTITVSCHCLMPSPFIQDIQEGARRGANAGWGGRPASGQRRIRESACKRPAQDKGKRLARGPTSDEGRAPGEGANAGWGEPGEEPALTAKVLPTGGSPGGSRADSDWRLTRREQGKSDWRTTLFNWRHPPFASALAFLLRSPFRSRLRQALHRARNR